jgi:alpha-beta hydrolase superfamily lysophospholipase
LTAPGSGLDFSALRMEEPAPLGTYEARDGARLGLRSYAGPDDLQLVLLHGSGSHGAYLAPLARALSETATVHTPDLRGHGPAPARRGDVDHHEQLETDLSDLVARLRQQHGGARVALAGHSSGGGLALRYAGGIRGADIDGVALLAPFLKHDAPTARPASGGWARPRVPVIVGLSLLNALGVHRFDDRIVITFDMPEEVRDGTETLAYTHRMNVALAPKSYRRELAALVVPLLVLVGEEDEAFRAEAYTETITRDAPSAQVELLPGVSHLGIASAPEAAARLRSWLEGL